MNEMNHIMQKESNPNQHNCSLPPVPGPIPSRPSHRLRFRINEAMDPMKTTDLLSGTASHTLRPPRVRAATTWQILADGGKPMVNRW